MLKRKKKYRLSKRDKTRIKKFIFKYIENNDLLVINCIDNNELSIKKNKIIHECYVGGSQSKHEKKFPNSDSDIDLYLFANIENSIIACEAIILSILIKKCLGYKNQIFVLSEIYKPEIIIKMENITLYE